MTITEGRDTLSTPKSQIRTYLLNMLKWLKALLEVVVTCGELAKVASDARASDPNYRIGSELQTVVVLDAAAPEMQKCSLGSCQFKTLGLSSSRWSGPEIPKAVVQATVRVVVSLVSAVARAARGKFWPLKSLKPKVGRPELCLRSLKSQVRAKPLKNLKLKSPVSQPHPYARGHPPR